MSQRVRSNDGIVVARPFGVPVVVSWTWFLGALLISWLFVPFVERSLPELQGWAFVVALCFAILLGLSVLVHELAHTVVAIAYGQKVRGITLHLLGGVSEIIGKQSRPWADFVIAAVGPLASLALAGIAWGGVQLTNTGTVAHLVCWQLAAANLIVGLFNLIPGLPLDGGRMLKDAVWGLSGRERVGILAAAWLGRALAVGVLFLAVWPIMQGQTDFIWLAWGVLLASFIWVEAGRAIRGERLRSFLPSLQAGALARPAIQVLESQSVAEVIRLRDLAHAQAVVTTDQYGRPRGVVNDAAVDAVPEERRTWVAAATVSRGLATGAGLDAELAGEDLLTALNEQTALEYVVTRPDGTIVGVLVRADVDRAINVEFTRR